MEGAARRTVSAMLDGIEHYRSHPYSRDVTDPEPFWTEGTTAVRDYRALTGKRGLGIPVVLVPSLVNRAYIMDLKAQASFARTLAAAGHPVFSVDWDAPGPLERGFDLGDYIARLRRAITACSEATGTPVAVLGYCMGGVLALAAARGLEERIDALVLLATPWDFHAERPEQARALGDLAGILAPSLALRGEMPADLLQTLFLGLDPMLSIRKFEAFAAMDPDGPGAEAFVALEDWLNDGVPLAHRVAQECLSGWYGRNDPANGAWRIDGLPVLPGDWRKPTLCVVPQADRIVPPASARALAEALPKGQTLPLPVGHIGMMVARSAPKVVWQPILRFLSDDVTL